MRRPVTALACVLLLLGAVVLPALSRADFDRVVDFSVTLKSLAAVAEGAAPLPSGRLVVLSGTVSDVNILNRDKPTFRVRIELITGEWLGTEDVKSYACYVDFSGPQYFSVFPARPPRSPVPGVIAQNSRVLLVGRPLEITTTPLGEKHVVLDGAYIRVIE